jgi:hypothetical protein
MKKVFYMLSSLMICLFTSCEKAEDSGIVSGETIPTYVETEDYVDLGFDGLLFATKNLGAKSPEESGNYFAWGEVKPKSYYDWKSYKWAESTTDYNYVYGNVTFSKYKYDDNHNETDYKYLQPEDDAATVILGEGWHTPTLDEMWNLISCEKRKTIKNGVFGYEYIGPNGNSIFLPSCGAIINDELINVEWGGKYWCSDCPSGNVATIIDINQYGHAWSGIEGRYLGLPIRPVKTEKAIIIDGLKYNVLDKYIEQARKLHETIKQEDYSISSYQAFERAYNHAVDIREIETKEKVLPPNPQDSINNVAKELRLAIMDLYKLPKPSDIKAVDLGLSVRWASANIGASNEDEYGYYISWGELTPKQIGYYRWNDYKLCKEVNEDDNDYSQLTKYVTNSKWGKVDNKTRLDIEDDAANAYLGGNWRIPTKEEFQELVDKCTIEEITRKGEPSLKVTGPNGNCIYFPYAGYAKWQDQVVFEVFYWTSDLDPKLPIHAYGFYLTHGSKSYLLTDRINGLPIRAVCP